MRFFKLENAFSSLSSSGIFFGPYDFTVIKLKFLFEFSISPAFPGLEAENRMRAKQSFPAHFHDLPVIEMRANTRFPLIPEDSTSTEMRAKQRFPAHSYNFAVIEMKGGKRFGK